MRRICEIRNAEGRVLEGWIVRWDDAARTYAGGTERMTQGALHWDDVILNLHHRDDKPIARGDALGLRSDGVGVRLRADLPEGIPDADLALALVRNGIARGLSVEMYVERDKWDGPDRVIERAEMLGAAVVTHPAYPRSEVVARSERRRRIWL